MKDHSIIISKTKAWIKDFVIHLNLCPFAALPFNHQKIRYIVSDATEVEELAFHLSRELNLLKDSNPQDIETTLLIHPNILTHFEDYNDFLGVANWMLEKMNLEGIIQIASFHPSYCFANVDKHDVSNYTNRTPYPLLHLLRENSIAHAVEKSTNTALIPERNIKLLNELGLQKVKELIGF